MSDADIIFRRRTADGYLIEIDAAGLVWRGLFTCTLHRGLPRQAALELAEAVGLFDVAELPVLVEAASWLSRGGRPVAFWPLVKRALLLSARAGTIPADMPPALQWVTLAAPGEPGDVLLRQQGVIPAIRPGRRVQVPVRSSR